MASRAIKPKREDTLLSGWQSLPERAPSVMRAEQPTIPRFIAVVGLMLTAIGAVAMLAPTWGRSYLLGPEWGFFWFTVGLSLLLYHAFTDKELQFRRMYLAVGFVLMVAGLVLRVLPHAGTVGGRFLPYGVGCLGLGLGFLLPVIRNEDEPVWRHRLLAIVGVVGAILAFAGFLFGNFSATFLMGQGVLVILLGLLYLGVFIGMQDTGSTRGFYTALAVGMLGAAVFVIALVRAFVPALHFDTVAPLQQGLLLMGLGLLYALVALGVCSDNVLVIMTRRELAAYFYSPIAYLVILAMVAVGWFMFLLFIEQLKSGQVFEPIVRNYIISFIPAVAWIFIVPVVTMRLLSEEKRSGTLEVLLTAPVNESTIVVSKFFASLFFYLMGLSSWGLFLISLRVYGQEEFDFRPILSFFITLVCTGAGFMSFGLFFSSLTRNQIIAAVLTFVVMIGFTIAFFVRFYFRFGPGWEEIFNFISYLDLWMSSLEGMFAPRYLLFHVSLAVFFLYLTTKVLEARKWA